MKTKILSFIIIAAACIGFAACDDDNWRFKEQQQGSLSLASMNVDVDDNEAVVSRANISLDKFIVDILDSKTDTVQRYTYKDMPEVVSLPEGDYCVQVRSHEVKDAEWETPYYLGYSETFTVKARQITEIGTVKCKFSNIKVTVAFTEELKKYMDENAHVRVSANDKGTLDFKKDESSAGYFMALDGSSTLVAEFIADIEGNTVRSLKTFSDVKAGQHYVLTFSVKNGSATVPDEFGSIAAISGINIDAKIERENVGSSASVGNENQQGTTVRPGNEEWPDDPTPPGPDQPGIDQPGNNPITIEPAAACSDLKLDGSNNPVISGNKYIINIHSDNGIENLKIDISSTNDGFIASAGELLPMEFDMAHLDDDLYESLASIGLEGNDAVLGKTDVPFDISELVPMLNAFKGTHTFKISVTDKEGNTLSKSLILKAE